MKRRFALPGLVLLAALLFGPSPLPAAAQLLTWKVTVDGIDRTALVSPGKDATTTPSPVVLAFHGLGGKASDMAQLTKLHQAWPEATVVYPQGRSYRHPAARGQTVSGWATVPGELGDHDLRFVEALLKDLGTVYKLDERRVFATGFSDGAVFDYVLLTLRPERFAAFAPVAIFSLPVLKWARVPRPVLHTMGKQDYLAGAEWARNQLLRVNGCGANATDWAAGSVIYQSCTSGQPVILSVHNGGHEWPPEATANVVRFFKDHALPAPPPAPAGPTDLDTSGSVVGTGQAGFSGDRGSATAAQLRFPESIALDQDGNLFIADTANYRIRRVGLDGIITTVAGTADWGFNPATRATRATLWYPEGIVLGRSGNLFIADTYNRQVRRVTPDGTITAVAGGVDLNLMHIEFSGDNGPGLGAELSFPAGLAIDREDNLFIADSENHRVRKVGRDGIINTVAGTGVAGFSGDGVAATAAELNAPWGLATDAEDNLFIVDRLNYRIRKVRRDGVITTVFGGGSMGDGGGSNTGSYYPASVAVDRRGNLLIADPFHHRIWKVSGVAAAGLIAGQPFPNP
jgi:poly(3-hydroxybutyrate) depolymerase